MIVIELFLCEVIRFRHTNSAFRRESAWRCLRQGKMGFKLCEIVCTEDKIKIVPVLVSCNALTKSYSISKSHSTQHSEEGFNFRSGFFFGYKFEKCFGVRICYSLSVVYHLFCVIDFFLLNLTDNFSRLELAVTELAVNRP